MIQATPPQNQLAKRPDVQLDLSEFGQDPLFLARVSDDPMHIGVIGVVATIVMLAAPGGNWLLLAAFWLFNANDITWALGEDPEGEESYEGETLDAEAQTVIDGDDTEQEAKFDQTLDCLGNPIVKVEQPAWPPVQEVEPIAVGFTRAADVIAESQPEDLLNLLGDRAPAWLKLQVAQNTFEYPEPHPEERLDAPGLVATHVPEAPLKSGVSRVSFQVSEDISPDISEKFQPEISDISKYEKALNQAVEFGPYIVPIAGSKGQVYSITRTAIAVGKTQTWISKNIFGANPGKTMAYENAVSYIKWVKEQ